MPESQVPSNSKVTHEEVSEWLRFVNSLIDQVSALICFIVLGVIAMIVWGDKWLVRYENIPGIISGSVIIFTYYFLWETLTGRTLGKLITGTVVVDEKGLKPPPMQILGRTLARLIPFDALSFVFGDARSGWHDTLSKTYVVKKGKIVSNAHLPTLSRD